MDQRKVSINTVKIILNLRNIITELFSKVLKLNLFFFFFFCIFLFLSGYNVSYVSGGDILQLLSGILKYKNEGNRL